ncbi:hypothetical protein Tco_1333551 [Tanacetum coccineum]
MTATQTHPSRGGCGGEDGVAVVVTWVWWQRLLQPWCGEAAAATLVVVVAAVVAAGGGDGGQNLAGDDGGGGGNSPEKERSVCVGL